MRKFARLFLIFGILLAAAGAYLAHERLSSPILGFYLVAAGLLFGVLVFLLATFSLFSRNKAPLCFVIGLACVGFLGYLAWQGAKHPINDISTDLVKIPEFKKPLVNYRTKDSREFEQGGQIVERPYNESFRQIQKERYPDILPLMLSFSADHAYALVGNTLKAKYSNWTIDFEDKTSRQIEAHVESDFFHFIDDILIVVRPWENSSSKIEIRSRSRVGRGDLGENAQRIRFFLGEISAAAPAFQATLPKEAPPPSTPAILPPNAPKPLPPLVPNAK